MRQLHRLLLTRAQPRKWSITTSLAETMLPRQDATFICLAPLALRFQQQEKVVVYQTHVEAAAPQCRLRVDADATRGIFRECEGPGQQT